MQNKTWTRTCRWSAAAAIFGGALIALATPTPAGRFTTWLDPVVTQISTAKDALPTEGLSKSQKKQSKTFTKLLDKFDRIATDTLAAELKLAGASLPKLAKVSKDDAATISVVDAAATALASDVADVIDELQSRLDGLASKVSPAKVQKQLDGAGGKLANAAGAITVAKRLKQLRGAEAKGRKAAKLLDKLDSGGGGGGGGGGGAFCQDLPPIASGDTFTASFPDNAGNTLSFDATRGLVTREVVGGITFSRIGVGDAAAGARGVYLEIATGQLLEVGEYRLGTPDGDLSFGGCSLLVTFYPATLNLTRVDAARIEGTLTVPLRSTVDNSPIGDFVGTFSVANVPIIPE